MTPWGDIEIRRFLFRVGLFRRRGMDEAKAEALADRLAARDQDLDERRVCVECVEFRPPFTCRKGLPISLTQLIRCAGFAWLTPEKTT